MWFREMWCTDWVTRVSVSVTLVLVIVVLSILLYAGTLNASPCPSGDYLQSPRVMDLWVWQSPLLGRGDTVYAVDASGAVVGKTKTVGDGDINSMLLHVYGDYPNTPEDEGLDAGEVCWLKYRYRDGTCGDVRMVERPRFMNFTSTELELVAPGDLNADGVYDVLDYIAMVNVVFRGQEGVGPEHDVNGDNKADVLDVLLLGDVVFRGGDPGVLRW